MGNTVWTGTQLGYALSGCRLTGGNVLLDWNRLTFGASDLLRYYCDDGSGNTVVEGVGAKNLTLSGDVHSWVDGWVGLKAVQLNPGSTANTGAISGVGAADSWTIEFWADDYYPTGTNTSYIAKVDFGGGSVGDRCQLTERQSGRHGRINYSDGATTHDTGFAMFNIMQNGWMHYSIVYDYDTGTYGTLYYYQNGSLYAQYTCLKRASATVDILTWGTSAVTDAYITWGGLVYASGKQRTANFSPVRYPASGTGTVNPALAQASCKPGLLTVTLSEALPAGTSLKAKLLSTTGGDTGFQTLSGSGTSYTYDFTGQVAANWYPAMQLFPGGALNINTPTVTQAGLDWSPAGGGTRFLFRNPIGPC